MSLAKEVELIHNEERRLLHEPSLPPPPRQHVPLLRGADHDVALFEQLVVCGGLASQLHHIETQPRPELGAPISHALGGQSLHGRYVHRPCCPLAVPCLTKHPQDGKLSAHSLAGPSRRGNQRVLPRVVQRIKNLGLDGVEGGEALVGEQGLEGGVPQRVQGKRLQVKKLGRGRVPLRQDEVPEADRKHRLTLQPPVRDHPDKVLGGEGLCDGHGEGHHVVVLRKVLLEQEQLVVQQELAVAVLHQNPERFHHVVHLLVPLEVGGDGEVDLQHGASDGLHVCRELQPRELVNQLVHRLAQLGRLDHLANLLAAQIVPPLPCQILSLHLLQDGDGNALELAERRLAAPQAVGGHLAQGQGLLRQARPPAAQADLEEAPHETAR
mmetsp:Transcript_16685/g.49879  ORF Transcript_16685/g.49879 Transcript_16685/m.49879 type:complete len:382 (-) Transcript_16685:3635-4780(-)